ncbi:4-hydroxy-3-methylbut-2-enyl diphosphate reductase [Altererythrobacter sp. Root672]|uniref:4-hydroxy-3-methylbut-2-enyl diphosphate reductase n=1 Tax=Altererythrobacter sp. Root672 TaxID=1736584 RepID=UPI0006F80C84|nr:4-hydroxy-3-methylbut-2-enyl diphosphate reductase [Altererythrobacter sp. Root672]KRA83646.1 4-hydroxy-3-methylbut-2-enyl diphosphate reductase [Altererythrobacter sp. Root672]
MSHGSSAAADPRAVSQARAQLNVLLAGPRGFCAGVRRAIDAVEDALERFGPPVYVRRAIVHNLAVVRSLEDKGAVFIQELDEAPDGAVVILSAHGVARSVTDEAQRRELRYFDAVCPLVAKVHREVLKHHRAGRHVVLVGHAGHPEIVGSLGQIPEEAASVVANIEHVAELRLEPDTGVAYAIQTTYSVDEADEVVTALISRFPDIVGPASSDICYATTNRQAAVKQMVPQVDAVLVAGESFSSNANRLAEVARAHGCASVQLIAEASQIDWRSLEDCRSIGITAAASTPEASVAAIIAALRERFDITVEEFGEASEGTMFKRMKVDDHAQAF